MGIKMVNLFLGMRMALRNKKVYIKTVLMRANGLFGLIMATNRARKTF